MFANWLLRSGIYGINHPLLFRVGHLFFALCVIDTVVAVLLRDGSLQDSP